MIDNFDKLSELDKWIYNTQAKICDNCKGIDSCKQDVVGVAPIIARNFITGKWELAGKNCGKQRGKCYSHLDIKLYTDLYMNENRYKIIKYLLQCKGGFIYGEGGQGKTYMLAYIANVFNKQGKSIYMDLSNNIANNVFNFDTRQETLNDIYKVDVLIIDDFGGDGYKSFNGFHSIYDVWTPILKNRIDNGKITYISSNYNLEYLAKKIEKVTDGITATTSTDRIRTLGVINFKDKNYRMK